MATTGKATLWKRHQKPREIRRLEQPEYPKGEVAARPYCVIALSSEALQSSKLRVEDFEGLVYVRFCSNMVAGKECVISFWGSREACQASYVRFCQVIGIGLTSIAYEGFVNGTKVLRKHWFVNSGARVWALMAATALLFSNLQSIAEGFEAFLGQPTVDQSSASAVVKAVEGQKIEVQASVKNTSRMNMNIMFGMPESVNKDLFLSSDPLQKTPFVVRPDGSVARIYSVLPRTFGAAEITTPIEIQAGLFRARHSVLNRIKLDIWPRIPQVISREVEVLTSRKCRVTLVIRSGLAYAEGCEAVARLVPAKDVRIVSVNESSDNPVLNIPTGPSEFRTSSLRWKTYPLVAQQQAAIMLVLQGNDPNRNREQWDEICQRVSVEFFPIASAKLE